MNRLVIPSKVYENESFGWKTLRCFYNRPSTVLSRTNDRLATLITSPLGANRWPRSENDVTIAAALAGRTVRRVVHHHRLAGDGAAVVLQQHPHSGGCWRFGRPRWSIHPGRYLPIFDMPQPLVVPMATTEWSAYNCRVDVRWRYYCGSMAPIQEGGGVLAPLQIDSAVVHD